MNRLVVFLLMSLGATSLHGWKSTEVKGEQPIFFGTLTTQESNTFYATNISIGRSRTAHDKIVLYEKPKNLAPTAKGNVITVNPAEDLTTAALELQKISKIEVPEAHTIWTWTNTETKRPVKMTYEYIELIITWRSGSSIHYLLELGTEGTRRPVKIFCDVIDEKMAGFRQDGTLFCPGIKKTELRKKGAPFQSIKELALDEPCFKVPEEAGKIASKNNKN